MLIPLLAGLFGLLIGSFLNVCIYRLPRDLSVVRPRSHCTRCEHTIAWYDNVPLLSFVLLGGKCRACGARIAWWYPVVELLTGAAFFLAFWLFPTVAAVKASLFAAMLIELIFSDIEERILPDEFTIGGTLLGLVLAVALPTRGSLAMFFGPNAHAWVPSLIEAAAGAGISSGSLWLVGEIYYRLRGREGIGLGDIKMVAMIGAFLGIQGVLMTLIFGSVMGSVVGIAYILLSGESMATYRLPFGTFLGIAALGVAYCGGPVLHWPGFWA